MVCHLVSFSGATQQHLDRICVFTHSAKNRTVHYSHGYVCGGCSAKQEIHAQDTSLHIRFSPGIRTI